MDAMGSTVTIDDASLLQDNHATDSGGAVWLAYSVLRMSETTCINNSAALCVTPLFMSQGHATCKYVCTSFIVNRGSYILFLNA